MRETVEVPGGNPVSIRAVAGFLVGPDRKALVYLRLALEEGDIVVVLPMQAIVNSIAESALAQAINETPPPQAVTVGIIGGDVDQLGKYETAERIGSALTKLCKKAETLWSEEGGTH